MTKTLCIASGLTLPLDTVTQTISVLAKRGVGKTHTAVVIAEEMIKARLHVVICDPVGVWWGLRSSKDGKSPGYDVVIFGGEHADIPLEASAGKLVAEAVIETGVSAVLDLCLFRKSEQTRFMADFCETLYRKNREPLHLILDEADAFAPQRPMKGQERMLGAVDDIVRRGRARGLGVTLITQRAAVINKDVLTQTEVMVSLRMLSPQDRKAADEWIKAHGTEEERKVFMDSLASLPIGTAWFWSPGWLDIFQKVKVRDRETFDSSATPKVGKQVAAPKAAATINLDQVRAHLQSLIDKTTAEKEEPARLRKEIAKLKRELAAAPKVKAAPMPAAAFDRDQVYGDGYIAGVSACRAAFEKALARLTNGKAEAPAHQAASGDAPRLRLPPAAAAVSAAGISRPQQRLLDSLATLEAFGQPAVPKATLAAFSGVKPTSGSYGNNLGHLRTVGLVDYPSPGVVALTDTGRAQANPAKAPTTEDLHQGWFSVLSRPQALILHTLIEAYPKALDKHELAERVGVSSSSGSYGNNLGRLRTLGAITYPGRGEARAADILFPDRPA